MIAQTLLTSIKDTKNAVAVVYSVLFGPLSPSLIALRSDAARPDRHSLFLWFSSSLWTILRFLKIWCIFRFQASTIHLGCVGKNLEGNFPLPFFAGRQSETCLKSLSQLSMSPRGGIRITPQVPSNKQLTGVWLWEYRGLHLPFASIAIYIEG